MLLRSIAAEGESERSAGDLFEQRGDLERVEAPWIPDRETAPASAERVLPIEIEEAVTPAGFGIDPFGKRILEPAIDEFESTFGDALGARDHRRVQ